MTDLDATVTSRASRAVGAAMDGLEVSAVSKSYDGVAALRECTFSVSRGRLTGFVGPNGAGKTTAMRVVLGLVAPDGGQVRWAGVAVDAHVRQRFGYMPEERGLYPKMRVRDQLVFFGRLSGLTAAAARTEADRWLDMLQLGDRATTRVDDLSHGNQQRVQLAVALLHRPELVVLDEPFSGLDPFAMESISRLLQEFTRAGTAVLFSSHQLDVVQDLCEDVVVIDSGRVLLHGALDRIRDGSPHRYLDVTTRGDPAVLIETPEAVVVSRDEGHLRLRVPRDADPGHLLRSAGDGLVRLSYEPPSLSELFRTAVATARETTDQDLTPGVPHGRT